MLIWDDENEIVRIWDVPQKRKRKECNIIDLTPWLQIRKLGRKKLVGLSR